MKRYAITGFVIWAAATFALRLGGQYLMPYPLALIAVSLPVMIFVAVAVVGDAQVRAHFPEHRSECGGALRRMAAVLQCRRAADGRHLRAASRV